MITKKLLNGGSFYVVASSGQNFDQTCKNINKELKQKECADPDSPGILPKKKYPKLFSITYLKQYQKGLCFTKESDKCQTKKKILLHG